MSDVDLSISVRGDEFLAVYAEFWRAHDASSFFRSPQHLAMIADLTRSRLGFVVAEERGREVAVLPFATLEGPFGAIINSLPYYGTCSAVIGGERPGLVEAMCGALLTRARGENVAAATFVDDWRAHSFALLRGADFVTHRTNQFINLSRFRDRDPLSIYHQKTRNLVRKAEKLGIEVRLSHDVSDIDGLAAAHRENMAGINGIAKPERFFEALRAPSFSLGKWKLYVASFEGRDCGYLLNFYCGDTVEYYMPSVYIADRSLQPLSLLIHKAICDAITHGYSYWNFGGTWPTQESLRHFKIRWSGEETEYSYFTYILDKEILHWSGQDLLAAYPYFYVAPFDRLGRQA
jgi:hypothetical protein